MKSLQISLLIFTLVFFLACSENKSRKVNGADDKRSNDKPVVTDSNSELSHYDLASKNPLIIKLPKELLEISGITMTPDGKMFAQQDESGIIFQIDYKSGTIIKTFSLGSPPIKKDFEDLVFVKDKFYMLESNGNIYEFGEGSNGESVEYKVYKNDLRKSSDTEGMSYDPETNSLLIALKGDAGKELEGDKAIYSFSLDNMKMDESPRIILPLQEIRKNFNPSGIQKNIKIGTYFIITANGNEIAEIDKNGKILGRQKLPAPVHSQPEGIAFDKDNNLYISNEGKSGNGSIVVYPYKK